MGRNVVEFATSAHFPSFRKKKDKPTSSSYQNTGQRKLNKTNSWGQMAKHEKPAIDLLTVRCPRRKTQIGKTLSLHNVEKR
jgi:hypothetical protein